MVGYTRAIAAEWGGDGITCNAVCPGYVDTALGVQPDKVSHYLERVIARTPAKRTASADEIAALVEFLVSPVGGYINGAVITADGGISADVGITSVL